MKVTLIMAMTLDGFIARTPSHFTNWTEIEDKNFFHEKTKEIGTIIMGSNTYRTLPGPLDGRLNIVMSSSGNLAEPIPNLLEFFSGEPKELLASLEKRGIHDVALVGGGQVAASFLIDNLIDDMYITVSPLLFGQGVNLFVGYELETMLKLLDVQNIGENSVVLHYEVVREHAR